MKNILILLTILLSSTLVFAQDNTEKDPERKKGPRGADFKGDRKFDRMRMMNERFKKENPEKFAELEKLRKENPEEFRKKLREHMQKRMSEGMKKGMGGERHWLHTMKEKDPKKYEELMKLRESDPAAFRQKMVQEFSSRYKHKHDGHHDKSRKEIGEILNKYNESNSEEEKAVLKKQLREKMEESFDLDLKKRIEMAEKLETHLKTVKSQIEEREAKKSSLIDEKVEYLIQGKFRKDGDRRKGDGYKRDGDKEIKRD